MTLILSKISADYILQVSDRLVTRLVTDFVKGTKTVKEHDKKANKSIIFGASDALVSIGYTGFAYIGKLPTDQWIAQKISMQHLLKNDNLPWSMFLPPGVPWFDLETFTIELKKNFDNVLNTDIPKMYQEQWINGLFGLSIAGWKWDSDGNYIPIYISLFKPSRTSIFKISIHLARNLAKNKYIISASPLSNLPKNERIKFRRFMKNAYNVAESEKLMVKTLQNISANNLLVGSDCMSILIQAPIDPKVSIKYLPSKQTSQHLPELGKDIFQIAYSPWLITPRLILTPSVITGGGWNVNLGTYQVQIDAPLNPKSENLLTASQRREKDIP